MTHFVLVPGACHGGWWYDPLVERLRAAGSAATAVTPAGLEPGTDLARLPAVTLDTHVAQVVDAVAAAADDSGDDGVVLVGHSYAGTLVTAAADRDPGRVRALVYLDAFVPDDGDSCWSMTNDDQRRWYVEGAGETGLGVAPLPFFDPRATAHPLATLVQRVRLTGAWRQVPVKHYLAATEWGEASSPFGPTTARLEGDPEFTVHRWPVRHNVLADGPDRVFDLLTSL